LWKSQRFRSSALGAAPVTPAAGSGLFEAFGAEIGGEGRGVELTCDVTIDRTMQADVSAG
jgi:hypothetical protein